MVNCSRSFYLVSFNTFDRGTHSTIFASGAGFDDFLPGFSFNRNPKSLFIPLSLIQYSNCSSLRADPNVLLIKAETTRPHYSSSLSLSPILLPSLQRHERVVFRTVAGHACPRVLYLPSFSRTFHSSLLVFPVRLSLFISSSLPFDHGVCTTRADHNTRYPWRRVLSPFTQFVF